MKKEITQRGLALTYMMSTTQNMTQAKIVKKTNLSQSYISALKNGDKPGSEDAWQKIASVFGMKYSDLLILGDTLANLPDPKELQEVAPRNINRIIDERLDEKIRLGSLLVGNNAEQPEPKLITPFLKEHFSVIKQFKDQQTAKEINKILVGIEQECPETFQELKEELAFKLSRLQKKNAEKNTDLLRREGDIKKNGTETL